MFTYRCPSCGKVHVHEEEFERAFESACFRCSQTIVVNEQLIHGLAKAKGPKRAPLEEAITAQPNLNGEEPEDAPDSTADNLPGLAEGEPAPHGKNKLRKKRTATAGAALLDDALDGEAADDEQEETDTYGLQPESPRRRPMDRYDLGDETDLEQPILSAPSPFWKRLPFILLVAVLIIGSAGGGAYYLLGPGKKARESAEKDEKPSKKSSSKVDPKKTTTASASKGSAATTKESTVTTVATAELLPMPAIQIATQISAARLSAELAADREATDQKYANARLEVSGLFDKYETRAAPRPDAKSAAKDAKSAPKGSLPPPVRFVRFTVEGSPVSCQLADTANAQAWRLLQLGKPFTVRGEYSKGGNLLKCELFPVIPTADSIYKGKEIEVEGVVEQVIMPRDQGNLYPIVVLERDTHGIVELDCYFPLEALENVKKLPPGTPVNIRGNCAGRFPDPNQSRYRLRLDNCRFIYSSAPVGDVPRLKAVRLLRDYEEDLRAYPPPAPDEGAASEPVLSAKQLLKEIASEPDVVNKKYRYRYIVVSGKVLDSGRQNPMQLRSGETNQDLRITCRFTRRNFADVPSGEEQTIRGLCMGMEGKDTLALECCECWSANGRPDLRRVVVEFLPHQAGRNLIYDTVSYPPATRRETVSIMRQAHLQRKAGKTEVVITHVATSKGAIPLDESKPDAWISQLNPRKGQWPGPVYFIRTNGGFVEFGRGNTTNANELAWEPVLKLGARLGDHWRWSHANVDHDYQVAQFTEHRGRPAVVIVEKLTSSSDVHHPGEIRHVYVRDVGEVERKEMRAISEKKLSVFAEWRLVEEAASPPEGN